MGSEVEGNKNPQDLECLHYSESENDIVPPLPPLHNEDSVSADNHATLHEINISQEQVPIPQPHHSESEMPPEISNLPSSTPQNDVVPHHNHHHDQERVLQPHSELPKPQTPPGVLNSPSPTTVRNDDFPSFPVVDMPAIGKFIRARSSGLSAAIAKGISSFKEDNADESPPPPTTATEINLPGVKVVVEEKQVMKGRISFFSKSNCRDCTAVRKYLRETGLRFVEINIDVYTEREKELRERTGTTAVPQIFLNDKLLGGLVALNSLRNSGEIEERLMKETMRVACGDDAPAEPVYGSDIANEGYRMDEMVGYVKVLRQRLPIQDRLIKTKMKFVQNCFTGNDLVQLLIAHLDCSSSKAVEIGKQLSKKHFIHHVFGENDFEDGNHLYRFLEHEPFIPKCFNFWGITNDSEPKSAVAVCQRLTKVLFAILESYASDDRRYLDYEAISKSEEFRRYVNMTEDLQRLNLLEISENERLAFFLNLYNAMVIHALVRVGSPQGLLDRNFFFSNFVYVVGGHPYSLNSIKHGILRCNRRPPYSLTKIFSSKDPQLELSLVKMNPLIHFGLCNGTKSSPKVRFFSPQGVGDELRRATREFFEEGGIEVDLDKRTVYLTPIIKWFDMDFAQGKDIVKWVISYLDATKAGFLTHLLGDGGPIHISYQNFDSSINS